MIISIVENVGVKKPEGRNFFYAKNKAGIFLSVAQSALKQKKATFEKATFCYK